ncbi:hypothetical protein PF005_g7015 [Phytophthora fragariae]|uniref:Uncharacterized protein n=1 Tax=Phytophthora fragariae TaxID=53985 RepID=A0A6A3YN16_9STRA|nr:hypothetical protein PF005_g7015 [Phytophthora fragariae]KAE9250617.1 hypothetical protein PF002_g4695 [Phytophthora fragariae]
MELVATLGFAVVATVSIGSALVIVPRQVSALVIVVALVGMLVMRRPLRLRRLRLLWRLQLEVGRKYRASFHLTIVKVPLQDVAVDRVVVVSMAVCTLDR